MSFKILCPCYSNRLYEECCRPYHEGEKPPNALALMRSRYSAYALNLPDYIIKTTHAQNPHYRKDFFAWHLEIARFSTSTTFKDLEILEFQEGNEKATVLFVATLVQNGCPYFKRENSLFVKAKDHWLYLDEID